MQGRDIGKKKKKYWLPSRAKCSPTHVLHACLASTGHFLGLTCSPWKQGPFVCDSETHFVYFIFMCYDDYYCLVLRIDPCDSVRVVYRLGHVILMIQKYEFIIQYECGVLYNTVSHTSQYNNKHYCLLYFGLGSNVQISFWTKYVSNVH